MSTGATHLARLGAEARHTGSGAVAEARAYCADALRQLGFSVREHSFEYSALPGAVGAPLAGVIAVVLASGVWLTARRTVAAAWWVVGIVALAAIVLVGVRSRRVVRDAVLDLPVMRRRGVNLEATRGSGEPQIWLVAHVDSKWQPVSMIARVAGVVVVTVGWLALLIELVVGASGWEPLALVWIGAVPLLLSFVGRGARNHGALDNASGVAAVLEAAALLPRDGTRPAAVGVLITDAEELALAGSRAWARARRTGPSIALNCDSIDDRGPLTVMHHRGRSRALADDLDRVARSCKEPLRVIPLLPGILTDSVALAAAGWRTVTLSRGTVRTLDRIHTSRDTLAAMAGSGITGTARVLARTVVEVMDAGNGTNAKRVMEPD